jgi:hypothetical protein
LVEISAKALHLPATKALHLADARLLPCRPTKALHLAVLKTLYLQNAKLLPFISEFILYIIK